MTTPGSSEIPLLVIGGPTGVGKSAAAINLAESLEARGIPSLILSADSRQVFRGFDIGTDKVSAEIRAHRRHAGIDIADARTPFTLYDWLEDARRELSVAQGIGIVVGGTGLYQRALLRGFLRGGARPADPELRARLEGELASDGRAPLDAQLAALHPAAAHAVAAASSRRLIRTLEITMLGGDPTTEEESPWSASTRFVLLDAPDLVAYRTALSARIDRQFAAGLVREAQILAESLPQETPALSGIGYAEALALAAGTLDETQACSTAATRTWAYARRQRTWYRKETLNATLDPHDAATPAALLTLALELVEGGR